MKKSNEEASKKVEMYYCNLTYEISLIHFTSFTNLFSSSIGIEKFIQFDS